MNVTCESYLESWESFFFFYRGTLPRPFTEVILCFFFSFFNTVPYPLQLCSLSRVGWLILQPEPKEKCLLISPACPHGAVVSWEVNSSSTTVWFEFVSTTPDRLIFADTLSLALGFAGCYGQGLTFSYHRLSLSRLLFSLFPHSLSLSVTIYIYIYIYIYGCS